MKSDRLDSLQMYRAIAAILVVLFHVTNYSQEKTGHAFLGNVFSFGYTGVDFFFVLSGFIIFYVHSKDIGEPYQLKSYLAKRLMRVYPIYWIVTLVKVVVITILPALAKSYEREFGVLLASLLLLPQANFPIIAAAWTLSYELYFYLLFGLAILLGHRRGFLLFAVSTVAVLSYTIGKAAGLTIFPDHYLTGFLLNERNIEFTLGCLGAYIVMRHTIRAQAIMALAGGGLFFLSGLFVVGGGQVPSYTLLFGLPSLLIVASSASLELGQRLNAPKLLVYLGSASYSIYLTHAMFINFFSLVLRRVDWTSQTNSSLIMLAMVVGAVLGGCTVYQYLERPLLSHLRTIVLSRPTADVVPISSSI